jgi:arylformamidase
MNAIGKVEFILDGIYLISLIRKKYMPLPTNSVKTVDLTLEVSQKTPTFPGSPQPLFIPWANIGKDGYNLEMLFLSSHTGTHVDAPVHFVKDGQKIHQVDPGRFLRDAVLIKIKCAPNHAITKSEIISHEKRFGRIESGETVVFATGWNDRPNRSGFFERNPGLSQSAARYLVSKKINLVGIDSPSVDIGSNSDFPVHHILLKEGVFVLENLCNLSKIGRQRFRLAAFPLKLRDSTGSPVRAVAF